MPAKGLFVRILALETTETIGSVALWTEGRLVVEQPLDAGMRSARSLAPTIRAILKTNGWHPRDVQLVAVTVGPGSFTGLRVGVTAAKTFAYAVGAEVMGFDTLEAIAAGVPGEVQRVATAVDAQRGDVVGATFARDADGWMRLQQPARLLAAGTWFAELPAGIAVASPVLAKLANRVPASVNVLDPQYWRPRAATVARLAWRDWQAGRRDDLWKLLPRYSRQSAAEEKWEAKRSSGPQVGAD